MKTGGCLCLYWQKKGGLDVFGADFLCLRCKKKASIFHPLPQWSLWKRIQPKLNMIDSAFWRTHSALQIWSCVFSCTYKKKKKKSTRREKRTHVDFRNSKSCEKSSNKWNFIQLFSVHELLDRVSPAHLVQQMAQLTRERGEWERRRWWRGGRRKKKGGLDWKQISSLKISTPPHVSAKTAEWSQTAFSDKLLAKQSFYASC